MVDQVTGKAIANASIVYSNVFVNAGTSGSAALSTNGTGVLIVTGPGHQGYVNETFTPVSNRQYVVRLVRLSSPSISGTNSIGYIGCSITQYSVGGYNHDVPDKRLFWNPTYPTGGGSFNNWLNASSKYWTSFDQEVATLGQPTAVWIQMCIRERAQVTYPQVASFFQILKSKVPNAVYYLSPHVLYDPPDLCSITGIVGVPQSYSLTNEAVANGLALAGPDLGPLTAQTSTTCDPDGIPAGVLLGEQLAVFFG